MILRMELLSDAIPGSGEGLSGIIDIDICHDPHGIPYVPGKRIKGILRESAMDLADAGEITRPEVLALFGEGGQKEGVALRISDGTIQGYEKLQVLLQHAAVKRELQPLFNPETMLSHYTLIRAQTTMSSNGLALDNSLRASRNLKRGLVFYFQVECPDAHADTLEKTCKVTRRFGISRSRGHGDIAMRLERGESGSSYVAPADPALQDDDMCELSLSIQARGQLLTSIQVGKNQQSESFIPGSFVLGALANAYIKAFVPVAPHEDELFRGLFLGGEVTFGNAYPASPDAPALDYFPAPVSIAKKKDEESYYDLCYGYDAARLQKEKVQTKGRIGDYVCMCAGGIATRSADRSVEYHHQRPEQDRSIGHAAEGMGEFYQFTVLDSGQHFKGTITGTYKYLKVLQQLLAQRQEYYLGKSKTAQYAKCILKSELKKAEKAEKLVWKSNDTLVVTLTSDMALRNKQGFTTTDIRIFVDEVAAFLAVASGSIGIEKQFLKSKAIGGFMGVWNMPKCQIPALAAGSVVVLKNNTGGDIDAAGLGSHCFGEKTEEGFGRVKLNWHGSAGIELKVPSASAAALQQKLGASGLEEHQPLVVSVINAFLCSCLQEDALAKKNLPQLPGSFIAKMLLYVSSSNSFADFNTRLDMRDRALNHLRKIAAPLLLREENKILQVSQGTLQEKIKKMYAHRVPSELKDEILPLAGIASDYYEHTLFNFYKSYALNYLQVLKFHNRKEIN